MKSLRRINISSNDSYLGITGITKEKEIIQIESFLAKYRIFHPFINYHLMLGYLVSYKWTNKGYPHNERYPSIPQLFKLLHRGFSNNIFFQVIHYNTNEPLFFRELQSLLQMRDKKGYDLSELIDGIQLNVSRPDPTQLELLKNYYPRLEIILQLNDSFQEESSIEEIGDIVFNDYDNLVDHILIDMSRGQEKPIDINTSIEIFKSLSSLRPGVQIGFAGGFSGDNIKERVKIIAKSIGTMEFSIDAEGRLRDHDDNLDLYKVEKYVRNFTKIRRDFLNYERVEQKT